MAFDVPEQLATIRTALVDAGWVRAGATYTHPDAPRLRLNTSYTYREATITVTTWDANSEREPRVVLYYRGDEPLTFAREHVTKINTKIFPSFRDSTPDTP